MKEIIPEVEAYFVNLDNWKEEVSLLRSIVLECGLQEDYKWMHPCYTFQNKNILVIHDFKEYCALSFFKGVLLKDKDRILVQPTENTQAGRQIRFTNISGIRKFEKSIIAYIKEAIELEISGKKVKLKETSEFDFPEELKLKLRESEELKSAWDKLTPGRQRGYLLHFSQPKQSKTRMSRIEKSTGRILHGKGLRDCICGHSKRMPNCDGSHKFL